MGRRLGQHFLTDRAILDRIVAAIHPEPGDVVIEIGPGRGSLTRRLAPRVAHVIAIERDARLAALLRGAGSEQRGAELASPIPEHVRVVHGDALKVDWHAELESAAGPFAPRARRPASEFKIVGNIPYNITSPLIDKALSPPLPQVVAFLVQREVAERLAAEPGTRAYGALTVGVRSLASVERLLVVRPGSFTPPPRVDSVLVRITPRANPLLPHDQIAGFRRFSTALFSQRRKQLRRILRSILQLDAAAVESELGRHGIDPTTRPEMLSPEEIVHLFRVLGR
ncbi:MAG: ribosomal RNA small subunit methyltransferase A [Gemmatimonadota bacterium]|nr:MAG: ribosomal RNA small subunit methyltransferase A [Gemmatimonadota bacterium]